MSKFSDTLQSIVNEDYSTLVKLSKSAISDLIPVCKKLDSDNNGAMVLSAILLAAIGADGKLSALEQRFLGDILDMTPSQIDKYTDLYSGKEEALVEKLADVLNADLTASLVMLIACICAVDETITRDETAFIAKLLD